MRFTELYEFEKQDITPVLAQIQEKCSDILAVLKNHPNTFLLRGMSNKEPVFQGVPRPDRKSLSTPQFISDMVDDWFNQYGFVANRSNSLFVTSNWSMAEMYGQVYMIFPVNGFDYTWFERSSDFWGDLTSLKEVRDLLKYAIGKKQQNQITSQDAEEIGIDLETLKKEVEWIIMRSTPKKTNIDEAIQIGHEIMIANSPYYAISQHYMPDIQKWIKGLK